MSIRLVLADDHAIVLHGLKRMFEGHADFQVVACCRDADEALRAVNELGCDVLVLDVRMPGKSGIDVLRALAAEHHPCRTVILTAAITDEDVVEAVKLGARGIVLKEATPETLLDSVRRVHRGEKCLDQETMTRALASVSRRETAARDAAQLLTPREIEIVKMIAQGLRNKPIADRLSISEGTVKIHLHNIYEKLSVDGRLALMLYAQNKGLV